MSVPFSICYSRLQHYIKRNTMFGMINSILLYFYHCWSHYYYIQNHHWPHQFISLTSHPPLTSVSHDYLIYLQTHMFSIVSLLECSSNTAMKTAPTYPLGPASLLYEAIFEPLGVAALLFLHGVVYVLTLQGGIILLPCLPSLMG